MAEVAPTGYTTKVWKPGSSEFPILLEHYQVLGFIGEGGMGTVFKARHLNLDRFVAIKTLRVDQRDSDVQTTRFKQEMALIGQMDHPNVVRATDAGERNGVFYLVMEYLSGSDLSRHVSRRGRLDIALACELICQGARGLDYIHEKGLVHRDIKPSNLLLTTSGQIKILDLGLARLGLEEAEKRELTPAGYAVGTYSYMAPEQATAGAAVDGRADIYSLGCTLFKLLTGRAPYSGPEYDNAAKVMYAHCQMPLASVPGFASIPEKLQAVLLKMTAKDPGERHQTGREVAEALQPFLADRAVVPAPSSVKAAEEVGETPVRPLTDPLPEELSRLTQSVYETPKNTPSGRSAAVTEAPRSMRSWPVWGIGAGAAVIVLAAALAIGMGWAPFRAPHGPNDQKNDPDAKKDQPKKEDGKGPPPPVVEAKVRDLDELPAFKRHALFQEPPLPPVGYEAADDSTWNFHKELRALNLHFKNPDNLFFALGKTARSRFSLEVGVNQSPWRGNIGIFWGYREDADMKKNKGPSNSAKRAFAWFQMIVMEDRRDNVKGPYLTFLRGRGALFYNALGEVKLESIAKGKKHDINLPDPREKVLKVAMQDNQLLGASFGGVELTNLCTQAANDLNTLPYQGQIGLFSQGYDVTFTNPEFYASAKK
jgi:serine/threonine protein kinase